MPRALALAVLLAACPVLPAAAGSEDPLGSDVWADMVESELGGGPVVYDDFVRLVMPDWVEEPHSVPLAVKLRDSGAAVAEIAVFAENNPIPVAVRVYPHRPIQAVGMNLRLERSTPVRAAALDADGVWHVAQTAVTVNSPGGCSTVPGDLAGAPGDIALKRFDRAGGASRLKVRIAHPMHTGFATDDSGETIAAYYIERIEIADERGGLADMTTWAALSHDPVFHFDLPEKQSEVRVSARDTAGLAFEAAAPAPSM